MQTFADQMQVFDARRRHARIRDEELAEEAGLNCSTLSRYRTGRQQPTIDRWNDLNRALDRLIARRAAELTKLAG